MVLAASCGAPQANRYLDVFFPQRRMAGGELNQSELR